MGGSSRRIVVGGNGKDDGRRRIDLAGSDRDIPGDIQRAIAAHVAIRRDKIRVAESLQREIPDINEAALDIQASGAVRGCKKERCAARRKCTDDLPGRLGRLKLRTQCHIRSSEIHCCISKQDASGPCRDAVVRDDGNRPGELHRSLEDQIVEATPVETVCRKMALSENGLAVVAQDGVTDGRSAGGIERLWDRKPALCDHQGCIQRSRRACGTRVDLPAGLNRVRATFCAGTTCRAEERCVGEEGLIAGEIELPAVAADGCRNDPGAFE